LGNSKELVLVHREMERYSTDQRIDIMVTPQFYTMKKEILPVRYLYQAKRVAPSIFEGFLEEERAYEYVVFREEDAWVFIAYSPEEIRGFLETKGLSESSVSKLFFAQQAVNAFATPVKLSKKEVLVTIDGVVVMVPEILLSGEKTTIDFDRRFIPKSGFSLPGSSQVLIHSKEAILLTVVFTLFAGIFFVEGWRYSQNLETQQKEMRRLLESYPSLQSKLQRESVFLKYNMIDMQERKKREMIKKLASMIFKGVTLTAYHMNEKKFTLTLSCKDMKVSQKVRALAKKFHLAVESDKGSNILVIKGSL